MPSYLVLTVESGTLLRLFWGPLGDSGRPDVEYSLSLEELGVLLRRRRSKKAIKKAMMQPPRKEPTIAPASVPVPNPAPEATAGEVGSLVERGVLEMPGVDE
jgi:hypothetical protein